MLDAIKPLLDSDLINEDTRQEINEAWEAKLNEAREQARAELREEFAQRYEHDKQVMVEALDRMVTEGLNAEIQAVAAEKAQLAEDRVKFQKKMTESATKFNSFLVTKLAEELGELRKDRRAHNEGLEKLEGFVVHALAREIREFAQDKQDLVNTKVKLVSEARTKLENLKARFVKESASKMSQAVSKHLKAELSQLHEDIKVARENNFGRRLFEAFASEFAITHLNENSEIAKLRREVQEQKQAVAEARAQAEQTTKLVESKDREIRVIKESQERQQTLNELLKPLNKDKQAVMRDLLESVQTAKLQAAYEKYLPAVLNNTPTAKAEKAMLSESRVEVTGDKSAKTNVESNDSNVFEIKRLAGLN